MYTARARAFAEHWKLGNRAMSDPDDLLRRMGEAASLPADDPVRRAAEAEAEAAGLEHEWRAILAFDTEIRQALPRVQVPAGLQDRLLAIPERAPVRELRGIRAVGWWVRSLTAAALLAAVFLFWFVSREDHDHLDRKHAVAYMALDNHSQAPAALVQGDRRRIAQGLTEQVSFDVVIPEVGPALELIGGYSCQLGSASAVCTRWRGPEGNYSLFQFQADDFGFTRNIDRKLISCSAEGVRCPNCRKQRDCTCCVMLWTDGGRAYALVADDVKALGRDLPR